MAEIFSWDPVAGNNNSAPPNGAPENMEYDEVNNTMREMYAVVARFIKGSLGGTKTTAGTQPAYTLVSGFTLSAYAAGQVFAFVAHASSTGNVTLNVDGLGAGAVNDSRGLQLGAGDIVQDGVYIVTRTASAFRVVGHLSASGIRAVVANTLNQAYLATGTANAIVVTTGLFTAYANGQMIAFRAANNNSGACTLNIDGLGAEALEDFGSQALATGDIITDRVYLCARTGGEWRVLTSLPIDLASQVSGILPVANGGTGGSDAATARSNLGAAASTVGQGKHTIWVPATAMKPRVTNGAATGNLDSGAQDNTIGVLDFDQTTAEHAQFCIGMPKGWNEGTVTFIPYWTASAGSAAQTCEFALGGVAISNDDSLDFTIGTTQASADALIATGDLHIGPESSAITIGGSPAEGDMVIFNVTRNVANDNLAADARLIGIKLLYTTNAATDD
jgi:hypothetical protein